MWFLLIYMRFSVPSVRGPVRSGVEQRPFRDRRSTLARRCIGQPRQLGSRVMGRIPSSVISFFLVSPAIPRVVATWTRAQRRQMSTGADYSAKIRETLVCDGDYFEGACHVRIKFLFVRQVVSRSQVGPGITCHVSGEAFTWLFLFQPLALSQQCRSCLRRKLGPVRRIMYSVSIILNPLHQPTHSFQ